MTKPIEQIRDEAASNFVHYEDIKESPNEFIMRNKASYSMGFDAGARAGYLKAIEVLRKLQKAYKDHGVSDLEALYREVGDRLESKIDEVLNGKT